MELKELLENPGTAAFSRIKYLQRFGSDEQIAEFVNALFRTSVEAKYSDGWSAVRELLERWDETAIGLQFQSMQMPEVGPIPWATLAKPLDRCKVALVTTGGVFLDGQIPYSERGDVSYREIPRDLDKARIRIWHPGYDSGPATADINCIFPIDRFMELEAEGMIGEQAQTHYSFMGLIPNPEALVRDTAPEVGQRLKDAGVDAAFLAST